MGIDAEQKALIAQLRTLYLTSGRYSASELAGISDEELLSIYNKELDGVSLNEDEEISVMSGKYSLPGLADGLEKTPSKPLKLNDAEKNELLSLLDARVKKVTGDTKSAKKDNGFIGDAWNWLKNTPVLDWCTDSTNDIEKAQAEELELLKSGDVKKAFEQITGMEFTPENVEKFKSGGVKTKSETALAAYKEGQAMAADTAGDLLSGIAAVGIYTVAVAAAPFTGGASLAVGFAAATISGAAIKVGVKSLDALTTSSRDYTSKELVRDLATGGFSGALAPLTAGLGGAVGKTLAKNLGVQAVKSLGKEVTEEVVTTGVKQTLKTALTNPAGYEYLGGSLGKRLTAMGAEMATDGALGGMIDNTFRTGYDQVAENGELDLEGLGSAAVQGFVGGVVMAPVIGGGMKFAGKLGNDLVHGNAKGLDTPEASTAAAKEAAEAASDEAAGLPVSAKPETEVTNALSEASNAVPERVESTPVEPKSTSFIEEPESAARTEHPTDTPQATAMRSDTPNEATPETVARPERPLDTDAEPTVRDKRPVDDTEPETKPVNEEPVAKASETENFDEPFVSRIANPKTEEEFGEEFLRFAKQVDLEDIEGRDPAEIKEMIAGLYSMYKVCPDIFESLMEKDAAGNFMWANSEKYDTLIRLVDEDNFKVPAKTLKQMEEAKGLYKYFEEFETNKDADIAAFVNLSPERVAFFRELMARGEDTNNVIEYVLKLRTPAEANFARQLQGYHNHYYAISSAFKSLSTEASCAEYVRLSKISSGINKYHLHNVAELINYPGGRKRIDKILSGELKTDAYCNITPEMGEIIVKHNLLEYDNLSLYDIANLSKEPETFTRLLERKLLAETELSGDDVIRMARLENENFDFCVGLRNKGFSASEALYASGYVSPDEFQNYISWRILDFEQIKTPGDLGSFRWLSATEKSKMAQYHSELAKAKHLSTGEIISLLVLPDDAFMNAINRNLFSNEKLSFNMISRLSCMSDSDYAIVLQRNFLDRVTEVDADSISKISCLSDDMCERYFTMRDKYADIWAKRGANYDDIMYATSYLGENIKSVEEFLYIPTRNVQFNIRDIYNLSRIESLSDPSIRSQVLEFAGLPQLRRKPLSYNEISDLLNLYGSFLYEFRDSVELRQRLNKVFELMAHEKRNAVTSDRIQLRDAFALISEDSVLVDKLIYVPERVGNQFDSEAVKNLVTVLQTTERYEMYKDFIYSPKRAEMGSEQLHGAGIARLIELLSPEQLDAAKSLLYVDGRPYNSQFSATDILHLARLSPAELEKIKPYFFMENLGRSGEALALFAKFNDKGFERLDRIIQSKSRFDGNQILKICRDFEDSEFENVIKLYEKFADKDPRDLMRVAELAPMAFENAMRIWEKYPDVRPSVLEDVTYLPKENIDRFITYMDDGVAPGLAGAYAKVSDPQIVVKYQKAISEAKAKRNQLKSAIQDLDDAKIEDFFMQNQIAIITAIDFLGLPTFTHSYTTKLTGVSRLVSTVLSLENKLLPETYAMLKKVVADKSIEPQDKLAKVQAIATLADYTSRDEIVNYINLIKPNAPSKEEVKLAKEIWANPKSRFEDKFNTFCETFGLDKANQKVIEFFDKRAQINAKGFKILNGVKEAEIAKLLEIEVIRKRNLATWNSAIDEKIYELINVPYSKELSERLNLAQNRYIEQILASNSAFKSNFGELVDELIAKPDKSIREVFDEMPHNIETRRQFEEFGIDYDAWVKSDRNSYKIVEVAASAEKMRQAAIENLEADFNDVAFSALPKAETEKIFAGLKEIGITAKVKQEPIYDSEGFVRSYKDVLRLYEGDDPIPFNKLSKAISVIKKTMNENDFWSTTHDDAVLNENVRTVYNHIMKLRDAEITNAAKIKDDEIAQLEIHKTDMNDISHSLFLGNHGSCCTAVGTGCNQYAAPRYCMDKCISAIEVMDGKDFVGNTMCYFAKVDGELALVLDNIELSGKYQYNDKIRDMFMEYAKQICDEVGKPELPIYAGPYRHKLNMTPYETAPHDITILGSSAGDITYIDFQGQYLIDGQHVSPGINMFKIR